MPTALTAPRVNNNDDTVQVIGLHVQAGDRVEPGRLVAEVETDKSVAEVEAEREGYVLKLLCEPDQQVAVGSVLMWIGDSPDEQPPETETAPATAPASKARPTAKARALLKRHGLEATQVMPVGGDRLTAADIEAYLASSAAAPGEAKAAPAPSAGAGTAPEPTPVAAGEYRDLSAEERGMLHTVAWHRDYAAATYLEVEYDPAPWEAYAQEYAQRHDLMLSPLLSLMAYRLVELARDTPSLNTTMVGERRYVYSEVNLGFTVQAGRTLYLAVLEGAGGMDRERFVEALGELQRHAMARRLSTAETQGATIAFSSMARWNVSRHVPILPPHTSLMIAHAAPKDRGKAVLGASYDHRVLSGFEVAKTLLDLAKPPAS
jgi:pyruvate/2-oxoglutarate dehydrogenase complex dihydrolipoamide acyltransferase (E2) component